jgi:hypothetical protein
MVAARIAVNLPQSVFMDAFGNIVKKEEANLRFQILDIQTNRSLGRRSNTKVTHPEYLIFFDETGCNTNLKMDQHYGGQKFGCGKIMLRKQICAIHDAHLIG